MNFQVEFLLTHAKPIEAVYQFGIESESKNSPEDFRIVTLSSGNHALTNELTIFQSPFVLLFER